MMLGAKVRMELGNLCLSHPEHERKNTHKFGKKVQRFDKKAQVAPGVFPTAECGHLKRQLRRIQRMARYLYRDLDHLPISTVPGKMKNIAHWDIYSSLTPDTTQDV